MKNDICCKDGSTFNDEGLKNNDIVFLANEIEMLKLCGNGDILVKGKLIENDKEVVSALRGFIAGVKDGD